ncbi:MAG: VOC family protein [Candidatus Heimdallarchaeota archaeon]
MHNYVHIQLLVTDLDKAIQFYGMVFGWNVYKSDSIPNYAIYEIDKEGEQVGGGFGLTDKKPSTGTVSLYINTEDIPSTLKTIEKHGGKIVQEKTMLPDGHGCVAQFKDPFGNVLGLWSEPEEDSAD